MVVVGACYAMLCYALLAGGEVTVEAALVGDGAESGNSSHQPEMM
jgi:hypothetical protein